MAIWRTSVYYKMILYLYCKLSAAFLRALILLEVNAYYLDVLLSQDLGPNVAL